VNILIIHQHFKTPDEGGALRSYFLAKALVKKGFKVQVLTGLSGKNRQSQVHIEGFEVHYLPVTYANNFGFWRRIFSFLKFVWLCIRVSRKLRDVELVYAISVPLTVGLAARWMKWRHGIPYIFEVGDLWPDAAIELDVIQNSILKNFLWRMERRIYMNAKSIVALSPAIREAIQKKAPGKTLYVIPNMSDCEYFKEERKDERLAEKLKVRGKFVVSYFGAMGFANGLEYLLEGARFCQDENLPIHFILAGDGAERMNLVEKSKKLKLNNFSFQTFQNRDGIHELMNVTDAVFVCYRNAPILETGSPNKFFDGLAAGKLIIVNFGGWIRKEIEEAQCGFYVNPAKPEEIAAQLKTLLTKPSTEYGKKARELAMMKFSREKLTEAWVDILKM